MDQDDMLNVLNENDLQVSLPSIVYYSYNKYKDITGCVIEVSDGLIYVIEDGEGIITDTIRLRNLTLLSRINLINELEDYYKYE
jgi:hypothetical protein